MSCCLVLNDRPPSLVLNKRGRIFIFSPSLLGLLNPPVLLMVTLRHFFQFPTSELASVEKVGDRYAGSWKPHATQGLLPLSLPPVRLGAASSLLLRDLELLIFQILKLGHCLLAYGMLYKGNYHGQAPCVWWFLNLKAPLIFVKISKKLI